MSRSARLVRSPLPTGVLAILGVFAVLAFPDASRAADIHVDAALGSDAADGASWASAKESVQAALAVAAAAPGPDTILVAAGRYAGTAEIPPETTLLGGHPSGGGARDWKVNRTILDGRGAGPVVVLGPGTDESLVDGFVIQRGRGGMGDGGGVTLRGTSARVASCLIEQNEAPAGAGVLIDARGLRMPPMLERCVVRGNVASAAGGGDGAGAGVLVLADDDASLSMAVLHHCRVEGNRALLAAGSVGVAAGGVEIHGRARLEHVHVRRNSPFGVVLDGAPGMAGSSIVNTEVSGSGGHGLVVGCGTSVLVDNATLTGNGAAGITGMPLRAGGAGATWSADVRRSILWDNALYGLAGAGACRLAGEIVADSIVEGGWAGSNVIDADPLFVHGPAMDNYLSARAAGQVADSPALDAGPALAQDLGLQAFTTRVDSARDLGPADWGAHCEPMEPGEMELWRGPSASWMQPWGLILSFPHPDAPLRNPAEPLVFYDVPSAWNWITLSKDEAGNVVLINF